MKGEGRNLLHFFYNTEQCRFNLQITEVSLIEIPEELLQITNNFSHAVGVCESKTGDNLKNNIKIHLTELKDTIFLKLTAELTYRTNVKLQSSFWNAQFDN